MEPKLTRYLKRVVKTEKGKLTQYGRTETVLQTRVVKRTTVNSYGDEEQHFTEWVDVPTEVE